MFVLIYPIKIPARERRGADVLGTVLYYTRGMLSILGAGATQPVVLGA